MRLCVETLNPETQLIPAWFVPWLWLYVAGLVVLGILTPIAAALLRRRGPSDDYAVRLFHNSAVPLAIQIVVRAIDFGFGIVLYMLLAQQPASIVNYGFAAFVTTLLLATVAEWGLNIYLTREVARDQAAIGRMWGTGLLLRVLFAALALPAGLLIVQSYNLLASAGAIRNGFTPEGSLVMLVLALTLLPSALSGAVTALFLAVERPIVPALVALMTNIVSTLLRVAVLVVGFGVVGVAWAALAATVVSATIFTILLVREFGWPGLRWDRYAAADMLRGGLPLMLNALLLAVFFRFDLVIIRAELPDVAYAAYDAAYKYVGLTQILPPIVINAIFPLFARRAVDDRAALRRAFDYTARALLLLALPIAAATTVLAPWLLAPYAENPEIAVLGAPALAILIWYLPLSYVNGVTQYALIALDRPRTITLAFSLAAVFNFAFNLVLIPRFGINVAAAATVLSEVVLYLPLWRKLRAEIEPEPLWRVAWKPCIAALAMMLAMLLCVRVHVLLALVAGPAVFWALLLALGVLRDDDRRLARRILGRI